VDFFVYIVGENKMKEKKYQREEGKNDAEKMRIPGGGLEDSLFSFEEENSVYYQLKYGGRK
jgi:hypothetical protein